LSGVFADEQEMPMSQNGFDALNVIKTPVWLISPVSEQIIFANVAATQLMGDKTLDELRKGIYSANAQTSCRCMYLN
jgi:hypothetical protein